MSASETTPNRPKRERDEESPQDPQPADDGLDVQEGPAVKKAKPLPAKRKSPPFTYRQGVLTKTLTVDGEDVKLKPRLVRHQYAVGKPVLLMGTGEGDNTEPFLFETPPIEILTCEARTDKSKKFPAPGIANASFWAMFNLGPMSDEYVTHAMFPKDGVLVSYTNPEQAGEIRMANKAFGCKLLARCVKETMAYIRENGIPDGVKKRVKDDQRPMLNTLKKGKMDPKAYNEMVADIKQAAITKVLRFPVKAHKASKQGEQGKTEQDDDDDEPVDIDDPETVLSLTVSNQHFSPPDSLFAALEGADEVQKKAAREALNVTTPGEVEAWLAAHEKFSKHPIGKLMALYPMDGADTKERWLEELAASPYVALLVNGCRPRIIKVYGPWGEQLINMISDLLHICHVDYYRRPVGAPPIPTWIPERGDLWKFKFEIVAKEQKKDTDEATFALKARIKEANVIRRSINLYGDKLKRAHGDDYADADGWNLEELFSFQANSTGDAGAGPSTSSSSSGAVPMDSYPTS